MKLHGMENKVIGRREVFKALKDQPNFKEHSKMTKKFIVKVNIEI